ncbi:hypothetical protein EC957_000179 [Mortierella hygrophila]|uniref:Uncharacterized protein n=1 Tax=Mortierella hygrophila TaxID=979708 RepID=A0A9P6K878_9FUNG|nr:hypothetical protein EC957_000179 [Mortierella hygrophila]
MPAVTPLALYRKANFARLAREIVRGIPAGLVISLNAWAVSAWLKATILINSQPRWLFRKKRWSEGEMRAISCYYLVIAYMMLRVVRLTSTLTKSPGRPYGDFFRNTRPILGQIAIFSIATMLTDEFVMFYILRKFGLEKRRILITGRPLDKEIEVTDDDCCICYGAMLDDDEDGMDLSEHSNNNNNGRHSHGVGINKDTDHVLENFCVVKQHVAHRGCIRKWYNYGPQGYRPMEAFRILSWGTTIHGAVAGMNTTRAVGNRIGLGWLMSLPTTTATTTTTTTTTRTAHRFDARVRLVPTIDGVAVTTLPGTPATTITTTNNANEPAEHDQIHAEEPLYPSQQTTGVLHTQTQTRTQTQTQTQPPPHQPIQQQQLDQQQQQQQQQHHHQHESTHPADVAEPVLRPMFTTPPTEEYNQNAGRKTCPACRQQLVLNFIDLAKGRKEMGWTQKLVELGRDMTKFSDWRGLVLRSLITAGWVGVTIVGGKLRIVAMDKAIVRHQKNRALATLSALAESS